MTDDTICFVVRYKVALKKERCGIFHDAGSLFFVESFAKMEYTVEKAFSER